MKDSFCEDKKCKIYTPLTPINHRTISDGICSQCYENKIFERNNEEFPANIDKGKTPKDVLKKDIEKQLSDEELNKIFNKNITSALKSLFLKK